MAILLLTTGLAAAQECTYESEPNDQPAGATLITGAGPGSLAPASLNQSVPACISGRLEAGDADYFLWRPSDLDAGHRWVIDLEGEPGQSLAATLSAVATTGDGREVTDATDLLAVSVADGSNLTASQFLINPGATYLLRFEGGARDAVPGDYVAGLRPVTALRYGVADERFEEYSANRAVEAPLAQHAVVEGELTQVFTVPSAMAGFQWDLELWAALGAPVRFALRGPGGVLASGETDRLGLTWADDLALTPGDYSLSVTGEPGTPTVVRYAVMAAGRVLAGTAVEPNDSWVDAGLIRPGDSVTGTLAGTDYFRLEIDQEQADGAWDIRLDSGADVRLGLLDRWGRELREARAGTARGLMLEAGAYRVAVSGSAGASYQLSVTPAVAVGADREPNDSLLVATPLAPGSAAQGG